MTDINICNRALSTYVRSAPIAAITEDSLPARQCRLHYDAALESLLQRHAWVWATRRESLALLVNDRDEWEYRYAAPAQLIRVNWVNTAEAARMAIRAHETPDTDREIAGGSIYSDVEGAVISFVKNQPDSAIYPPLFSDALAAELASRLAMPITQTVSVARSAMDAASELYDRARAADAGNSPAWQAPVPESLSARGVS